MTKCPIPCHFVMKNHVHIRLFTPFIKAFDLAQLLRDIKNKEKKDYMG